MSELPFAFQSYQSRSLPFSAQRLINLYWENGPQAGKTQGILFKRPGQSTFATIGDGPIRGIHTMKGTPFVVSGQEIYTVDSSGTGTLLGTVAGTDLVDMDNNGTQVAIVADNKGYIATTSTVQAITDADFRTPTSVVYQDSYFIWTEADSARFFISAAFDGLAYDALDFATAEYGPDNLVKVFSDHDDLLNFGMDTIEPWFANGSVDFPFSQQPGTAMEVGLLARDTVQKIDNSIFWLGSDRRGGRTVWRAAGYTPQRVSTHALESKWDTISNPENAYAFTFRMEGHAFYVLTFPDVGTYVYDASTGLWSEWQTFGKEDWSAVGFSNAYGKRIIGDRRSNKLYEIDPSFLDDAGDVLRWEATSPPVPSENNELIRHNFIRIDIEPGVGLESGQGSDPQIWLEWSDEDGARFSNKHLLSIGKSGETKKRVYKRRLGLARSRIYRISGSDPVKTAILGGYLDVTGGRW